MGCGGAESPKQVAVDYANAVAKHDGKKLCSLFEPSTKAETDKLAKQLFGKGAGCSRVSYGLIPDTPPRNPVVSKSEVTGDNAIVTLEGDGRQTDVHLKKVGGAWRVTALAQ